MRSTDEPLDRNAKGNIAEAAVVFHAARLGIQVFRPLLEHGRYDLVLEVGSRLLRVQCKWARRSGEVLVVGLTGSRLTATGYVRTRYLDGEIDAVAAYCGELDRCYLLPSPLVVQKSAIQLRLAPTKNGQRAGLNWATRYELSSALAAACQQSEEGIDGVLLGAPDPSVDDGSMVVGAHEFRNRFGHYMELADGGTRIEVTRRGRPSVCLTRTQPSQRQEPD